MSELIVGEGLAGSEGCSLVGVEPPCEVVAVDNSEDPLVDIEVLGNTQVLPGIVLRLVVRQR